MFNQGRIRPKGWVRFCFFLSLSLPAFAARERVNPSVQVWLTAFDFFAAENDTDSLDAMRTRILALPRSREMNRESDQLLLIGRVLDERIANKDRKGLLTSFTSVVDSAKCRAKSSGEKSRLCAELKRLWVGNLDSLSFFEDSAAKLEKARRAVEARDCSLAQSVTNEIEIKEGLVKGNLLLQQQIANCLSDAPLMELVGEKLRTLSLFDARIVSTED